MTHLSPTGARILDANNNGMVHGHPAALAKLEGDCLVVPHSDEGGAHWMTEAGWAALEAWRQAHPVRSTGPEQVREDAAQWAPVGRATVRATRAVGHGTVQATRAVGSGTVQASQRAATAWKVHNPPAAVRNATRNAAASALIVASPPPRATAPRRGPGGGSVAVTRQADPADDARRRVFDALMQAQRTSWQNQPTWGGDPE
ncbi:hypothetical protein [Streptomyces cyaneofuscatus]|uniref:hypothetical protein n=1 Tax=Streptomyces cyaneofuscatus TaxID=66883 RepID=UPI00364D42B0